MLSLIAVINVARKLALIVGRSMSDVYKANCHEKVLPSLHLMKHIRDFDGKVHAAAGEFDSESFDDAVRPCILSSTGDMPEELQDGYGDLHDSINSDVSMDDGNGKQPVKDCNGAIQHVQVARKRPFCKRCEKAQDLCICRRFKGIVRNTVKITILQNPKEKQHAVGSVRVALLGLENVALVDVPEINTEGSFRIRPKVPGSNRSLAGRGGKKVLLNSGKAPMIANDNVLADVEDLRVANLLFAIFKQDKVYHSMPFKAVNGFSDDLFYNPSLADMKSSLVRRNGQSGGSLTGESATGNNGGPLSKEGLESLIPPGVALLFPSDKAVELPNFLCRSNVDGLLAPRHLLVLDGTWSKARRIYFENPWLQFLPHYKLSPASPSRYEGVRKQPKPGCLSTLESIVYALQVLEPENEEALDGLLGIFDSMVEDQRRCKQMKHCVQDSQT